MRVRSIETAEGPPGSDPSVVRLIVKLDPPASQGELREFKQALHEAVLIGGSQDGVGFDVQVDVDRDTVGEAIRELRAVIDGPGSGPDSSST